MIAAVNTTEQDMLYGINSALEERGALQKQKEKLRKDVKEFVEHSTRISGVGFMGTDRDWEREGIKRHLEIACILMIDAHRLVNAQLINSALTNRPNEWLRTGRDAAAKNLVPSGEYVKKLIDQLDSEIEDGVERLQKQPESKRAAFAQYVHDMLLCISPFKEKNSRTARLLLGHVRKMLSLPILVIRYEESDTYMARFEEFRQKHFLPKLPELIRRAHPQLIGAVV